MGGGALPQSVSATQYVPPTGGNWSGNEPERETIITTAGTIGALRIVLPSAPAAGTSYQFTVRKNGSSTSTGSSSGNPLRCTVTNAGPTCQNLTAADNFPVAVGDRISLESDPTGSAASLNARWSLLFRPTTANRTILSSAGSFQNTTVYGMPGGLANSNNNFAVLAVAEAGTISDLTVRCAALPTAGTTRTFTVRLNGAPVSPDVSCTMNDTQQTCTDTDSFSIGVGQRLNIHYASAGQAAATGCALGVVFTPTTSNRFLLGVDIASSTPTTGTIFTAIQGNDAALQASTENATTQHLAQVMTMRAIALDMHASPGASCTQQATLRVGGLDSSPLLSCQTAANGVGCNATADVTMVTVDNLIGSSLTAGGTGCGTVIGRIGYAATFTGTFP